MLAAVMKCIVALAPAEQKHQRTSAPVGALLKFKDAGFRGREQKAESKDFQQLPRARPLGFGNKKSQQPSFQRFNSLVGQNWILCIMSENYLDMYETIFQRAECEQKTLKLKSNCV